MTITNRDTLIAAMAAGYTQSFSMTVVGTSMANNAISLGSSWVLNHRRGDVPATTGIPALCSAGTPGALPLPTLGAGNQFYLGSVALNAGFHTHLFDRLAHVRFDPSITTTQSFSMTRPARNLNPHGVNVWLEMVAGAAGTGSLTLPNYTISYTNSDGVAGRTGNLGTFNAGTTTYNFNGGMIPMALQSGDRGVSSVQSITAASALTGFTLQLVLNRTLAMISPGSLNNVTGQTYGFFDLGGTPLGADPCITMGGQYQLVYTVPQLVSVRIIQG